MELGFQLRTFGSYMDKIGHLQEESDFQVTSKPHLKPIVQNERYNPSHVIKTSGRMAADLLKPSIWRRKYGA